MTKMRIMGMNPPSIPKGPEEACSARRAVEGPKIGFIVRTNPGRASLPSRAPLLTGIGRNRQDLQIGSRRRVFASGTAGEQFRQRTESDSLPDVGHEVKVIADDVQGGEDGRGQLAAAEQVVEEGARGPRARRAAALVVELQRVVLEAGVLDLERRPAGKEDAVTGV